MTVLETGMEDRGEKRQVFKKGGGILGEVDDDTGKDEEGEER